MNEWVPVEFTRAALAVLEEGRSKKWKVKPLWLPSGRYLVQVAPALADHLQREAVRTGRTPSEIIIESYVGAPPSGDGPHRGALTG